MARTHPSGSTTAYLSVTLGSSIAMPLTLSVWVNRAAVTHFPGFIQVGDSGGNNYFLLTTANTGNQLCLETNVASTATDDGIPTPTMAANTWYNVCGVWTSATNRVGYLNGTASTAGTTSLTPTGTLTSVLIGTQRFNGSIVSVAESYQYAYAGIWNVALSAAQVGSLAAGASPLLVQPSGLVLACGVRGVNSPEIDFKIAGGITVNGTPTATVQPRQFVI